MDDVTTGQIERICRRNQQMSSLLRAGLPRTCRSELARDAPENAAGHQASSVIVDVHRERARSYRECVVAKILATEVLNPADRHFSTADSPTTAQ
ncbi:hypothetical protein HNO86_16710 [Pseudomonas sp. C1C7]|uniref:hypothetical protein n=1 Tax=Pseudomonas sp. C1C7 TaxID=2735272 RepID=UPI0015865DA2|nr:hypothetical protein [Pseudomonas sp. C1C7]NUT76687.1 hypothetical protein [Pseudomonas sp. C1C7]